MRSLAHALADALSHSRARQLNAAIRLQVLPKGTNSKAGVISAKAEQPIITPKPRPAYKGGKYLGDFNKVDVNSDHSPEYREAIRRATLGIEHTAVKEAIRASRHYQAISGQSETVEVHMNLMKPTTQRHAPDEPTPDPYLARGQERNFIQERKVDVNSKTSKIAAHKAYIQSLSKEIQDETQDPRW